MSKLTGISAASARVCSSSDFQDADGISPDAMRDANFVRLEGLDIAILNAEPDQRRAAMAATVPDHGVVVEPELWNYPLGAESQAELDFREEDRQHDGIDTPTPSRDFLLGVRAAVDMMLSKFSDLGLAETASRACSSDSREFTWGLRLMGVHRSKLTGAGSRVAILDSGLDTGHPDFAHRSSASSIHRVSFIPNTEPDHSPDDRNGHGTHCTGTACGPETPARGPRYGVAPQAEVFSGKVLRVGRDGRTSGADGWILAGIDWALRNRCHIISMSLGSRVHSTQYPMSYERAAQQGLLQGTVILAAAGNDSARSTGFIAPVGRPANCPSIAAIAAIDSCRRVADFSNGQRYSNGGESNLAAPGVDVLSIIPRPRDYARYDGTSMATPHVAGVAALLHEETGATGLDLYRKLTRRARKLGNSRDFGHGLVTL